MPADELVRTPTDWRTRAAIVPREAVGGGRRMLYAPLRSSRSCAHLPSNAIGYLALLLALTMGTA
jgi:hypothetical protein